MFTVTSTPFDAPRAIRSLYLRRKRVLDSFHSLSLSPYEYARALATPEPPARTSRSWLLSRVFFPISLHTHTHSNTHTRSNTQHEGNPPQREVAAGAFGMCKRSTCVCVQLCTGFTGVACRVCGVWPRAHFLAYYCCICTFARARVCSRSLFALASNARERAFVIPFPILCTHARDCASQVLGSHTSNYRMAHA